MSTVDYSMSDHIDFECSVDNGIRDQTICFTGADIEFSVEDVGDTVLCRVRSVDKHCFTPDGLRELADVMEVAERGDLAATVSLATPEQAEDLMREAKAFVADHPCLPVVGASQIACGIAEANARAMGLTLYDECVVQEPNVVSEAATVADQFEVCYSEPPYPIDWDDVDDGDHLFFCYPEHGYGELIDRYVVVVEVGQGPNGWFFRAIDDDEEYRTFLCSHMKYLVYLGDGKGCDDDYDDDWEDDEEYWDDEYEYYDDDEDY